MTKRLKLISGYVQKKDENHNIILIDYLGNQHKTGEDSFLYEGALVKIFANNENEVLDVINLDFSKIEFYSALIDLAENTNKNHFLFDANAPDHIRLWPHRHDGTVDDPPSGSNSSNDMIIFESDSNEIVEINERQRGDFLRGECVEYYKWKGKALFIKKCKE